MLAATGGYAAGSLTPSRTMEHKPLTQEEIDKLTKEHNGEPQCQTCMQPQRCLIGRLLDTLNIPSVKRNV